VAKKDGSLHVFESTLLGPLSVHGITGEVCAPENLVQKWQTRSRFGSGNPHQKHCPQLVMPLTLSIAPADPVPAMSAGSLSYRRSVPVLAAGKLEFICHM